MDKNQALTYYERFLEEVEEQASEEIRIAYKSMRAGFDEYLSAVQEDMFQQAFRYGYEMGIKSSQVRR